MWARVKHGIAALFGGILGFGASVALDGSSALSIASAPWPAGVVMGITFSKAHARGTKKTRRKARRQAAERRARVRRREEADKKLQGTRRPTLAASCAYDSYASVSFSSVTYVCGGVYFQRYKENGVTGFEGHAVGIDRGAIKRAKARRAAAEKKRRAKAKKELKARRRPALAANCAYDSYASVSATTDRYICGGIYFRQYREKGVTGFEMIKP